MNQRLFGDVHQLSVGWNEVQTQMKEKDEIWGKLLTVWVQPPLLQASFDFLVPSMQEECGKAIQSQRACLKTTLKDTSEVKEDLKRVKSTTRR